VFMPFSLPLVHGVQRCPAGANARSKNVGWTLIGEKGRGDCQQGRGAEPWSGIGDGETPEAKKTFIQLLLLSAFRSLVVDVT